MNDDDRNQKDPRLADLLRPGDESLVVCVIAKIEQGTREGDWTAEELDDLAALREGIAVERQRVLWLLAQGFTRELTAQKIADGF